ncbi:MAG: invasion associated locus B family protein [Alphaproteobacteria bacterium]
MMLKTVLAATFTGLMTCAALAQAPAAAPAAPAAPASNKPEVNTVQDWAVRCFPIQSPSPCDMFQELDNQRTGQRVISMSIAFYPSLNRHALVVAVPLEVSIPAGLKLQTSTYTSPMLKYRRCDRNGCYVELAVENNVIESLARSSGDAGKIVIAADSGKVYNLNFSLKGFSAAHDDMVTKARAKAKTPAAPAAAPASP